MAGISLLKCTEYSFPKLKETITEGLSLIGFPLISLRSMKVVLKPNLLSAVGPESGIVTHPAFFHAVASLVLDHGGVPVLADSPAVATLHGALKASGYDRVVRDLGIEVADVSEKAKISYPGAKRFRAFEISKVFFEADVILNLPKLKTHNLTYVTLSVKNLFGAIPGMKKSQMHLACPGRDDFSDAILDLYGAFLHGFEPAKPLLHVMDAVVGLEGDGPGTGGKPRQIGAVIIGADGLAVDWVAMKVAGLDPSLSPILVSGMKRGYGIASGSEVEVLGASMDSVRIEGFAAIGNPDKQGILGIPPLLRLLKRLFTSRPVPSGEECTLCYQCEKICPAQAITKARSGEKVPVFDYGRCIRCYCCMEVCPHDALAVKKGFFQWVLR